MAGTNFQLVFGNPSKGKSKSKTRSKTVSKKKRNPTKKKTSKKKAKRNPSKKRKSTKRNPAKRKKTTKRNPTKRKKATKRNPAKRKKTTKRNPLTLRAKDRFGNIFKTELWKSTEVRGAKNNIKKLVAAAGDATPSQRKKIASMVAKFRVAASKKGYDNVELNKIIKDFKKRYESQGGTVAIKSLSLEDAIKANQKPKKRRKKVKKRGKSVAKRRRKARKSSKKRKKSTALKGRVYAGKKKTTVRASSGPLKRKQRKKVKWKYGRKSGSLSVYRKNPVSGGQTISNYVPALSGFSLGSVDVRALGYYSAASVAGPVVDGLMSRVPVINTVYGQMKSLLGNIPMVGPALSSLSLSIFLTGVEAIDNTMAKKGKGFLPMPVRDFNEALATVALLQVTSGLISGVLQKTPLSGVMYSPLSGVKYTPLSGVQYHSDKKGRQFGGSAPQMGHSHPQMGYGADFGRYSAADYGGGSGYTEKRPRSSADFGGYQHAPQMGVLPKAMSGDEEPVLDQSLGQMG